MVSVGDGADVAEVASEGEGAGGGVVDAGDATTSGGDGTGDATGAVVATGEDSVGSIVIDCTSP